MCTITQQLVYKFKTRYENQINCSWPVNGFLDGGRFIRSAKQHDVEL